MTDYQLKSLIKMIDIILEGCKSIEEAREKISRLKKNNQIEVRPELSDNTDDTERNN